MKRKAVLFVILLAMVVAGGGVAYYYWYQGAHYVTTEDARVTGDIYRVMPRVTGKVTSLSISEGDTVMADQIVGQQDDANLQPHLLENALLRSPITGTVIKILTKEGEVAAPGQAVAMVVDENNLYISANVEETEVERIAPGQKVEIAIDAFPEHTWTGRVKEIGEATNSTFALLPAVNTSGNFTKVTQRIPVKIVFEGPTGVKLAPGMSATIKIHVKGK